MFETVLERIGRIISRKYNVEVVFEGNQAKTDGKKIYLPAFAELSTEMKNDLNGYLDHEVAHVLFTEFSVLEKCNGSFHKHLLNAVEDVRIERKMTEFYPGCSYNLNPLNAKWTKIIKSKWQEYPSSLRLCFAIRDKMLRQYSIDDKELQPSLDSIQDLIAKLNDCESTNDLLGVTEEIVKRLKQPEDEQKKTQSESESKNEQESASSFALQGAESKDEPKDADDNSDNEGFDGLVKDVHSFIDQKIKREVSKINKTKNYDFSNAPHVALTKKFDKVTDHSGVGCRKKYANLKRSVQKYINPISQNLERLLKVRENAQWKSDQERGIINQKSMSRFCTDPFFKTPFKSLYKVETKNVAVTILVDLSGSMSRQLFVAKQTCVAMSEALKNLEISFEVLGFNTQMCYEMLNLSRSVPNKRFNRKLERLDHHVFKSFDCDSQVGITNIFSGANNTDGESVRWAASRLFERREPRKILFVLSDGLPHDAGKQSILNQDLKNAVAEITRSGIECIGIGIESNAPRYFYKDFIVINKASELTQRAMVKLSQILQK